MTKDNPGRNPEFEWTVLRGLYKQKEKNGPRSILREPSFPYYDLMFFMVLRGTFSHKSELENVHLCYYAL